MQSVHSSLLRYNFTIGSDFEIEFIAPRSGKALLQTFGMGGKLISEGSVAIRSGVNTFEQSADALSQGVFVSAITFEGKTYSKRFVK